MGRSFSEGFVRKIIRADYHLDDELLGGSSGDKSKRARRYLEEDSATRSKYITGRFVAFVFHGFTGVSLGFFGVAVLSRAEGFGHVGLACVILLLACGFLWGALKAQSLMRWMVRNWRTPILARRSGITQKRRTKTGRTAERPLPPSVKFSDLFDIVRTWFMSEFVRKYVKAEYRSGDRLIVGYQAASRFLIVWYPEEYLSSGKLGRLMMLVTTILPFGLALQVFYGLSPLNYGPGYSPTPLDRYLMAIILYAAAWVFLGTQSFIRWMLRNWNARRTTEPS